MAAASLQSLTSLRATVEAAIPNPPVTLLSEAAEAAGTLQILWHRFSKMTLADSIGKWLQTLWWQRGASIGRSS